jgi:hypothetical protein
LWYISPSLTNEGTCIFRSLHNISFTAANGLVTINQISLNWDPAHFSRLIIEIDGVSHAKNGLSTTPEFKKPPFRTPGLMLMIPLSFIYIRVLKVSVTKRGEPAFYAESIEVCVRRGFATKSNHIEQYTPSSKIL